MLCPYCRDLQNKVVNSRLTSTGESIRRRRECLRCGRRFTTLESIEKVPIRVIKRGQERRRETFDRQKITNGIRKACEKRPVSDEDIEQIANYVTKTLYDEMEREVTSEKIGELVLKRLKELDEVAYVRFASVYRKFKDVSEFSQELRSLLKK
jgi:transcriptional repressor NrdR